MPSIAPLLSQVTEVQPHQNQTNFQLQTTNMQGSAATMQQNNMASMQHTTLFGVLCNQVPI
uniref:Uncharacterized protein n=1 Tax=Cajanus cajan TaxID=3821 RepID=A0A151TDK4_CAJCA|nr:hypothetical protein KK1_011361 [Cajanus cajan]